MSSDLLEELKQKDELRVFPFLCYADRDKMLVPATIFWIRMMFVLPGMIVRYQPDAIVFTSMVTANLAIPLRLFGIRTPLITINHGHDITMPSPWYQFLIKKITFKLLDGVISVSRATRITTLARGFDPEKAVVISNGLNLSQWNGKTQVSKAREALKKTFNLPLEKNTKILLTVGRQVKRKGHRWFIKEVLPKIQSDAIYLVIGDGPEHDKILREVEKSDRKDKIFILGRQPDSVVRNAYRAADLFVMPNVKVHNDMEGFGLVMIEANVSETAVIATDIEGIRDVIANGENGYRIKYKDSESFASKIDEIFARKEDKKLGRHAREYVKANFTWPHVAKKYIEEIDNLSAIKKKELLEKRKTMIKKVTFGKVDYEKVMTWVSEQLTVNNK